MPVTGTQYNKSRTSALGQICYKDDINIITGQTFHFLHII